MEPQHLLTTFSLPHNSTAILFFECHVLTDHSIPILLHSPGLAFLALYCSHACSFMHSFNEPLKYQVWQKLQEYRDEHKKILPS